MASYVHSTHLSPTHSFSKTYAPSITLVAGIGVQGDCHSGTKTQHLSYARADSTAPNLRQVHLMHGELFHELAAYGFSIQPGELGENITTVGIDLLALPRGTYLYFGDGEGLQENVPVVQVTGLRYPGAGIERHKKGLLEKLLVRGDCGKIVAKAGVMGIVVRGGCIKSGDQIRVLMPEEGQFVLEPV